MRVSGVLTKSNRHHLHIAVLKCLTECPSAIIVDLTGLDLRDPVAAAVFVALRRRAAAGPGIRSPPPVTSAGHPCRLSPHRDRPDEPHGTDDPPNGPDVAVLRSPAEGKFVVKSHAGR